MTKSDPEAKVDAYLASPAARRHLGGPVCRTCQLDTRDQIDRALRRFHELRAAGQTTVPWRSFLSNAITKDPEFRCSLKWRALLQHAENCLGLNS